VHQEVADLAVQGMGPLPGAAALGLKLPPLWLGQRSHHHLPGAAALERVQQGQQGPAQR
jgi:hypothetical protein